MKGLLAEIPLGEKAKARPHVVPLSAHTLMNWRTSLDACEEEVGGHENVPDSTFHN